MRIPTAALALAGTTALIIPATATAADPGFAPKRQVSAPVADHALPTAQPRSKRPNEVQDRATRRTLRLARRAARLTGEKLPSDYRERLQRDSLTELGERRDKLRAEIRAARRARAAGVAPAAASESAAPAGGGGAAGGTLEAIAACESGGDPGAVDASGTYFGKFQFDQQTWQSVGGTGSPASASEAEQNARATQLYAQRGSSPWPVCGR